MVDWDKYVDHETEHDVDVEPPVVDIPVTLTFRHDVEWDKYDPLAFWDVDTDVDVDSDATNTDRVDVERE